MKTLTLTKPYGLFDLMRTDLNQKLIDDLFSQNKPSIKNFSNIKEAGDHVVLEMIVPGFKKAEIEITIENNLINIIGKKELNVENESEKFILKEFSVKEFSKSFKVNPDMDLDQIESKLEDGILQIKIPKSKKLENKKIIKIK